IDGVSCGIFNTPIIDINATPPLMYVSCKTSVSTGWQVYAIKITDGTLLTGGWPVTISNAVIQSGSVLQNGPAGITDSGVNEGCRGALNLSADGSILYVPISDVSTVTGFMVTIDTKSPALASAFAGVANAPNGGTGDHYAGFWSADGASVDSSGNVYVCTG